MRVAAQVEVAVAQTGRLVDRVLVELERERFRACHDLERLDLDLDLPGREIRVDRVGSPADDLALRPKHELAANLVRDLRRVGGALGVDHELADPGVVPQIDEDEAAVVAAPRRPAGKRQLFADVRGGHFAAVLVAPLVHREHRSGDRLQGDLLLDVTELDRRAVGPHVHEAARAGTRELRPLALHRATGVVGVARDAGRAQLREL